MWKRFFHSYYTEIWGLAPPLLYSENHIFGTNCMLLVHKNAYTQGLGNVLVPFSPPEKSLPLIELMAFSSVLLQHLEPNKLLGTQQRLLFAQEDKLVWVGNVHFEFELHGSLPSAFTAPFSLAIL